MGEVERVSLKLIKRSKTVLVGSIDAEGYPAIKAMFHMENEGLHYFWLGTNTSSEKVRQFRTNPHACLYFVDMKGFHGLTLAGEMEVLEDPESKKRLWREGYEIYYPGGVTDPDYCVLRFTAKKARYYHALQKVNFNIE
ncbi:MAG TPA: pyridoxamine 5'-phosphate oxidase family protein [Bacillota bacterium]|nr:pyridoxamine 5'-phosphate oxidase family protein [Bacillota bacterium]